MEKYGTYEVFKNKNTGEVKREPTNSESSMEKTASEEWEKLESDPADNMEDDVAALNRKRWGR